MAYLTDQQKTTLVTLLADNGLSGTEAYAASNALNAPVSTGGAPTKRRVTIREIQLAAFRMGLIDDLLAAQASANASLKGAATIVNYFFSAPHLDDVDTESTEFQTMLETLKAVGLIDDTKKATIEALADTTTPVVDGPSKFATAFPGFTVVIDGVTYRERCHAALIEEARS